jgi:hypothetical protein
MMVLYQQFRLVGANAINTERVERSNLLGRSSCQQTTPNPASRTRAILNITVKTLRLQQK